MLLAPEGLTIRLITALTILVAIVAGLLGQINVHIQEEQLLDEMKISANQLSNSITSATWHTMLADQPDATYRIMENIAADPAITNLRIFNKEGRVTYSTDSSSPKQVSKDAEACYMCHSMEQTQVETDVPYRIRIFTDSSGERQMDMIRPIYNEPACSNADCHAHGMEKSVLGVLDITMGLRRIDDEVTNIRNRTLIMTLIQIILIGLLIVIFTRRFVDKPIRKLIHGTKVISTMDLDQPFDTNISGELGELASSFDLMRIRLKEALKTLNDFTQDLEAKVDERTKQLGLAESKLIQSDKLASLGQLAASVAHEINNPISGVLNLSMLMQRIITDDGIPPQRINDFRKYLHSISTETARVGHIVSDLLSFSRRSSPQRATVDLNQIVGNTISLISHKLEMANVQLDLWLDQDLPPIPCDRSQMQQVVINLVMNSAEAIGSDGRISLRTRMNRDHDRIVLEVEDSGPGIQPTIIAHIFDPFFTTKEEGKGVGLGLAVVYGIIDAHEGTIDASSPLGKGAIFRVTLPISSETGLAKPDENESHDLSLKLDVSPTKPDAPSEPDA